jgi:hypothetical protein
MSAPEGPEALTGVDGDGEAGWRDAIGRVQGRSEVDVVKEFDEAAEEGRVAAVV